MRETCKVQRTYFNASLEREFGKRFDIVTTPMRSVSLVVPQARVLTAVGSMARRAQEHHHAT